MDIAIIKYNAGNVQSLTFALNRLGVDPILTDDPETLQKADKVIFPGVGEASTAMNYIRKNKIDEVIKDLHQPFLGVCLGLQLMCKHSEENDTECIGVFDNIVKKFDPNLKVPHMGWNTIIDLKGPLFEGVDEESYLYFVHSYYAETADDTIATCDYANRFSAALHKDNYYAVQAHPEKSSLAGQQILKNFLELT
ncbi:MAG: imidazole glycerol phosphate synthase subunit HisH [bacterium]|nr:imidazole glycerol phosphate synthase subunit HisH [bacterium]